MTDDFLKAAEAATKSATNAKEQAGRDTQSLINKTANDKAITGAELLDIMYGFGLIPKPTPSKPASVKK